MLSILSDIWDRLDTLHLDIEKAIAGLPQEALDWVPGRNMNSLAVLVVHLAGAERYWIGEVAGRDRSNRDRPAEFEVWGLDEAMLRERLRATAAHSLAVLERLTPGDLSAARVSARDGQTYTVAWALAHALEHTALHLGHIQMMRQLWEQRAQG